MELTAYLDEHRVDMTVMTSDGTTVAIECENDTILSVQRHIAAIAKECPEIATWGDPLAAGLCRSKTSHETAAALDAAVSEGWPAEQSDISPPEVPQSAFGWT